MKIDTKKLTAHIEAGLAELKGTPALAATGVVIGTVDGVQLQLNMVRKRTAWEGDLWKANPKHTCVTT